MVAILPGGQRVRPVFHADHTSRVDRRPASKSCKPPTPARVDSRSRRDREQPWVAANARNRARKLAMV